jgi:hypothetical protein
MLRYSIFALLLFVAANTAYAHPQQVRVGVYLMNMYSLNMDENSFYADFYIWFKWKGDKDPTNIEFVNAIEKWSMDKASFDGDSTPVRLKDGTFYKIFRVEARFLHNFSLNRFPLDAHDLDIQIENPEYPAGSLIYLPDTSGADIRKSLNLSGWESKGCRLVSTVHDYQTNFGNPEENARHYSNISYFISLSRPISYFLLKMLLPLFIVMLVSIGGLFLHPTYIDARTALPIGGLLTAVFLQQSYNDALPDTGYMVLMDKIYVLAYVIISLAMWQMIVSGNWINRKQTEPEAQMERRERTLAFLYLALFCLGTLVLCL